MASLGRTNQGIPHLAGLPDLPPSPADRQSSSLSFTQPFPRPSCCKTWALALQHLLPRWARSPHLRWHCTGVGGSSRPITCFPGQSAGLADLLHPRVGGGGSGKGRPTFPELLLPAVPCSPPASVPPKELGTIRTRQPWASKTRQALLQISLALSATHFCKLT